MLKPKNERLTRGTFLAAGLAAGAALPLPARAQQHALPLQIGITADDASAEPLYAKEMNFFREGGLDADVDVLANGAAIISAVVGGAYDIGSSNVVSVVTGYQKGLPLRIIAPASVYDGTVPQAALVVPNGSPIRTAKDLEGKTIATNQIRGVSSLSMIAWMRKHGADASTIKWIEMSRGDMGGGLAKGRFDAAMLTEPFIAVNRKLVRLLGAPYSAVASRWDTVAFFTTEAFAKANPEKVARFAAVIHRTALWANANQAKSGAILAKYSKIDGDLIRQMSRVKYGTILLAADVQPCVDVAVEAKLIDAPFSASQLIYQP